MNELDQQLIAATWRNDIEEGKRLIALGADVNAKDSTVQSSYLITTSEGYLEFLYLTLQHGADVTSKDSYNGTGLIRAADRGHADIIGALMRAGIEMDHINNLGWTALHESIILGNGDRRYTDCVRLLMAGGADPELVSQRDGISPLQHAEDRDFEAIATTLRMVIDTAVPVDPGQALVEAVDAGDADAAALALRAGATNGQDALELARSLGHLDVSRLLHLFIGNPA